jgi:transcriptional repressor NrdR
VTRRRRECLKCEKRFTTYERVEMIDLMIIKKDGKREPYSRDKVKSGLLKACEKRPVSQEKIEQVVDKIEAEIRNQETTEVPSTFIGELVMKKLKTLDKVAYIRFASVYKAFADIDDFKEELNKVLKK